RRHTISKRDWSSDVCSSDLKGDLLVHAGRKELHVRVLEYDPHLFAQVQQFLFPVGDRLAVIVYLSLIRPQYAVAAEEEGGFPGEIGRASCRERVAEWAGAGL